MSVDQFYELLSSKRVLGNSWTTSTVVKRPSSLPYDHDLTMTDSAYTRPGLENLIFITKKISFGIIKFLVLFNFF